MSADLTMDQAHSIWLVPDEAGTAQMRKIIELFSRRYDGPVFAPHVTLLGDLKNNPNVTAKICRNVFANHSPVEATIQSVERTDAYFMSLFIDLTFHPDLTAARRLLSQTLTDKDPALFRAHLSLTYGLHYDREIDTHILSLLNSLAEQIIVFNSITIVKSAKTIPIADWSILSQVTLK